MLVDVRDDKMRPSIPCLSAVTGEMAILLAVVAANYLDIEVGLLFAGAAAAASTPLGLCEHELVVAPFAIGLCAASSSCV
jgi:hypothetical protein